MMADQPGAAEVSDQPDEDVARAQALNGPMQRLRTGEITARQADAAWEAADVLPYATALPGGVPGIFWPLPLVVAWIATRRHDLAEREALRAQFHGERVAREPAEAGWATDFATARRHLHAALMEGKIAASGGDGGLLGRRLTIAAVEWQDLVVLFAEGSTAASRAFAGIAPPAWCEITVRRSDVLRLWPAVAAEDCEDSIPERERPRSAPRGRAEVKAAKALARDRAKDIIAGAPGGMPLKALRAYVQKSEPTLSRADVDALKDLYRDRRGPGDNARTLASRKSPK